MQKREFIVFGTPKIEQPEIDEVVATLKSGWLGTGPKVAQFENDFKNYKGTDYAVAVNSCTAALHLSLLAVGLKPGDEVITTPLTFCASINAIIHAGATPILADIDPVTMNIDPDEVEKKIASRTKGLLPVHFAGRCCDMDRLCEIKHKFNLKMVEDCAHSIETEYKGKKAGTFGELGAFSFYVTKNIVTGEGGMIISNNEEMVNLIKRMALHGMSKDAWKRFSDDGYKHYQVVDIGFKYNMMDIQAAIGIHQLKRIDEYWKRRRYIWNRYIEELQGLPIELPSPVAPDTRHGFHLFTILISEQKTGITRDQFLVAMNDRQIGLGVHYLSIPEHPYYKKKYGWNVKDYPNAARIGRQTVSLPLSAKLSDDEVEKTISAVREILGGK